MLAERKDSASHCCMVMVLDVLNISSLSWRLHNFCTARLLQRRHCAIAGQTCQAVVERTATGWRLWQWVTSSDHPDRTCHSYGAAMYYAVALTQPMPQSSIYFIVCLLIMTYFCRLFPTLARPCAGEAKQRILWGKTKIPHGR